MQHHGLPRLHLGSRKPREVSSVRLPHGYLPAYSPSMTPTPTRWIAAHREMGHHPHPAPTKENPEQWECKCDPDAVWIAVWRIHTP